MHRCILLVSVLWLLPYSRWIVLSCRYKSANSLIGSVLVRRQQAHPSSVHGWLFVGVASSRGVSHIALCNLISSDLNTQSLWAFISPASHPSSAVGGCDRRRWLTTASKQCSTRQSTNTLLLLPCNAIYAVVIIIITDYHHLQRVQVAP